MADELATMTPQDLAGFDRRLADAVDSNKGTHKESLVDKLMRH